MKKVLIIFMMLMGICSVVCAARKVAIKEVTIKDIDYPYSTGSTLDTSATVTSMSKSYVKEVKWSQNSSGLNVVKVTVRPYINYFYDENTIATINGNKPDSVVINEDDYLEVTYTFEKNTSISLPNSSSSLKHVISVLYTRNGKISPNPIRAPHGKNFTVQIIPDEGYKVKDVVVDGDSEGAITEYTFKNVRETHKIKAFFEKIEDAEDKPIIKDDESGKVDIPKDDESGKVDIPKDDESGEKITDENNTSGDTANSGEEINSNAEIPFLDVTKNDFYYDAVKFVYENKIFAGISEKEFAPKGKMTRAMMVKVLFNMTNGSNTNAENSNFAFEDVPSNAWYKEAIDYAVSNGIVKGTGNNKFSPDANVTREQVCVILYNYAVKENLKDKVANQEIGTVKQFEEYETSNEVSTYAKEAFAWAVNSGLIDAKASIGLDPKSDATRFEIATIVMRFISKVRLS